jgi:hypothetical protein
MTRTQGGNGKQNPRVRSGIAVALALAAVGCPSGTPALRSHHVPPVALAVDASNERTKPPPVEAQRLREAVSKLALAPRDLAYGAESTTLRTLAECVRALSVSPLAGERISDAADRLSCTAGNEQVRDFREALTIASGVLAAKHRGD